MHVHDIHMDITVKDKMANLQQKKYVMWVVTAQESVKSQQYEHGCAIVNDDSY